MKKKKKLRNLIGSRKILKDLKEVASKMQADSEEALKLRNDAKSRDEYQYWRGIAIERHETARQLMAFIDIYKIF